MKSDAEVSQGERGGAGAKIYPGPGAPGERPDPRVWDDGDPLTLAGYWGLLWPRKFWIGGVTALCAAAALLVAFSLPDAYRASAVIKPDQQADQGRGAASLGLLASFGLSLGAPSKAEDLEVLFHSRDLTARVFSRHDLWLWVYPDRFDPVTRTLRPGVADRLRGRGRSGPRAPDHWDAVRAAEDRLTVSVDRRSGVVSLAFDARDPDAAARILELYLAEGRGRLQEEALARARHNKEFLLSQTEATDDLIVRERLYLRYGEEVEREMLAKNSSQFGFVVVDTPRSPDEKHGPRRLLIGALAAAAAFLATCVFFLVRDSLGGARGPRP
ncbi:MAG: Wzz/FepE/Etk N-terminal domain-containing protein [Thermodesulfobacteriota bacterium]